MLSFELLVNARAHLRIILTSLLHLVLERLTVKVTYVPIALKTFDSERIIFVENFRFNLWVPHMNGSISIIASFGLRFDISAMVLMS
jgi:hypothetical protein